MSTESSRRDLARLLMPTWRALLEIETRRSAEHDLSHWHYIVLADVQEHPDSSQNQIARRIVRSPSRLATDVDELCSRGLLSRTSAAHDRRVNRLTLTADGQELTRRVRRLIHLDEDRLLARLTDPDQTQLRDLLTRALDPEVL
jgi:MarR family transcriptional regulator for hemolysin